MRPSLLTWLCTSRSAVLPRLCFEHVWHRFLGCLSLLCGVVHALFLCLSSSSFVNSRSATSYLATALLSARSLQHCIRRLSCGLLEVGIRNVLDLAAGHRLRLRNFGLFLKSTSKRQEVSRVSSFHLGHLSCGPRDANLAAFLTVITRSLYQ